MQAHLLRDLINTALDEPNQEIRIGTFWCFAPDYDDYAPLFESLMSHEHVFSIEADGLIIIKGESEFVVIDPYEQSDIFTYEEIRLFIFLWEESFKVKENIIYMP